jgi:hypothetical protein
LIFGTTELKNKGLDTPNEKKLAKTMRDAWTGFAKDPVHGLEKLGWPVYDTSSKITLLLLVAIILMLFFLLEPSVVVIGGKDSADIKFESTSNVDPMCSIPALFS